MYKKCSFKERFSYAVNSGMKFKLKLRKWDQRGDGSYQSTILDYINTKGKPGKVK